MYHEPISSKVFEDNLVERKLLRKSKDRLPIATDVEFISVKILA